MINVPSCHFPSDDSLLRQVRAVRPVEVCALRIVCFGRYHLRGESIDDWSRAANSSRRSVLSFERWADRARACGSTLAEAAELCLQGPLPRTRVEVDEAGATVGGRISARYELARSPPGVMAGYSKDPDATDGALRDGWYSSGDLGFLFEGELYVTGRKKDLIIVAGRNIYLTNRAGDRGLRRDQSGARRRVWRLRRAEGDRVRRGSRRGDPSVAGSTQFEDLRLKIPCWRSLSSVSRSSTSGSSPDPCFKRAPRESYQ